MNNVYLSLISNGGNNPININISQSTSSPAGTAEMTTSSPSPGASLITPVQAQQSAFPVAYASSVPEQSTTGTPSADHKPTTSGGNIFSVSLNPASFLTFGILDDTETEVLDSSDICLLHDGNSDIYNDSPLTMSGDSGPLYHSDRSDMDEDDDPDADDDVVPDLDLDPWTLSEPECEPENESP